MEQGDIIPPVCAVVAATSVGLRMTNEVINGNLVTNRELPHLFVKYPSYIGISRAVKPG